MADAKIPDIGKYHILELVGEGAMGVVYKAEDSILHRMVAIKVMNDAIARQEELRQRFLHEAQAAASLQHPNVVSIYDLGEVDGHLFIAMEFVTGLDLEHLIDTKEPLTLQARLDIVIDVLTGLAFAHKRGIVHRDIKPANIRVAEDGRAKIMDFGVAHLANSKLTSTGASLGTPTYMAPEQIVGGKTTPGTDIFAVGGVLYELLTGVKPFDGETLQNLFFKIITENARPIHELRPELPVALERIVNKAMTKDPAERYATALEMADELTAVRSKLSGGSYPDTVSLRHSVEHAISQSKQESRLDSATNRALVGGSVLVAIAAAVVAWTQLARSRPERPAGADTSTVAIATAPGVTVPPPVTPPPASTGPEAPVAAKTRVDNVAPAVSTSSVRKQEKSVATPKAPAKSVQKLPVSTPTVASAPPPAAQPAPQPAVKEEVVAQRPPVVPAETAKPTPEGPPPAPTAADLAPTFEAYARAIESRDVSAIRRVYPGLTADQQRGFEQFFQSARRINVTFRVANVEGSGATADARLSGTYEYESSSGKMERQPVSFAATVRREGSGWRLVSLR
jgi:eukaryotic-like serine/threonine-protein kinase